MYAPTTDRIHRHDRQSATIDSLSVAEADHEVNVADVASGVVGNLGLEVFPLGLGHIVAEAVLYGVPQVSQRQHAFVGAVTASACRQQQRHVSMQSGEDQHRYTATARVNAVR